MSVSSKCLLPFVLFLALAGCMPLQQAPLVYASKVTLGVDVSVTSTEQPGLSINLGYKQIDAAYVPVAVSKPCEGADGTNKSDCTHETYALKDVTGKNTVGDTGIPNDALAKAKGRVDTFKKILQAKETKEAAYSSAAQAKDTAEAKLKTAMEGKATAEAALKVAADERAVTEASLKSFTDGRAAAEAKLKTAAKEKAAADDKTTAEALGRSVKDEKDAAEELKKISGEEKVAADARLRIAAKEKAAADEKVAAEAKLKAAVDEKAAAEEKLKMATKEKDEAEANYKSADVTGLLAELNLVGLSNLKTDAYSVFGTFDAYSKAGAEFSGQGSPKAEAALNIGKVFSTGVASQNLTEGMRDFYKGKGASSCLIIAKEMISDCEKKLTESADDKKRLEEVRLSLIQACTMRTPDHH